METLEREVLAKRLIFETAPVDFEAAFDAMDSETRGEITRTLDALAERAAFLGEYAGERYGYGCGDQGHKDAVKKANRRCKSLWVKVFGYNAHHGLAI